MTKRKVLRITKGQDPYLEVTAPCDYCQQKGWIVLKEYVDKEPITDIGGNIKSYKGVQSI
jgi:hypothetical protein